MADPSPITWGVTVEQVSALAPHVGIIDNPPPADAPVDDVYGGEAPRKVTKQAVEEWIQSLSGLVAVATRKRWKLTDPEIVAVIEQGAHDIVVNGAASYLVAAAHPNEASINDQASYSAVLWERYKSGLAELVTNVDAWLIEEGVADVAPAGRATVSFPPPLFPDGLRW